MATDIKQIINNLLDFYDFTDKIIVSVGAGGGQLIEYGRNAKQVIAIDNDAAALQLLRIKLNASGLNEKFTIIHSDFYQTQIKSDIVLFEFSLHEIENPALAIAHAKTIAADIVILDHSPDSEWAFLADEDEKVRRAWSIINTSNIKDSQQYHTNQSFKNYNELYDKLKIQGENSINRISKYKLLSEISILMNYGLVLL